MSRSGYDLEGLLEHIYSFSPEGDSYEQGRPDGSWEKTSYEAMKLWQEWVDLAEPLDTVYRERLKLKNQEPDDGSEPDPKKIELQVNAVLGQDNLHKLLGEILSNESYEVSLEDSNHARDQLYALQTLFLLCEGYEMPQAIIARACVAALRLGIAYGALAHAVQTKVDSQKRFIKRYEGQRALKNAGKQLVKREFSQLPNEIKRTAHHNIAVTIKRNIEEKRQIAPSVDTIKRYLEELGLSFPQKKKAKNHKN